METFNPASINPLTLPSIPLRERKTLPDTPGIYFVMEGACILYIGKAANLLKRWKNHQRWFQFKSMTGDIRLAWLECSEPELLPQIEAVLIDAFNPLLNERRSHIHGEKKKQWQFLLTETASLKLDRLAQAEGVSRSEYLERLIRDQEDVNYAAS